ncbi:NUDIX hydrolase [Fictibacillus aquaticus]|uniref:DNA mismatch repair protein MutT n=1 Tax=Fictibacillus aquaticus TaxID=2021314 RepID=A0A235F7M7_9BACL|nr:NUDIX domain-containing protein [Fictibacillus aquaticus]OYD57320.1 DNA mismatch repair protein MutT [Fictibacillus aquaticus]
MDYITYLRSMVGHSKVIMAACGVLIFDHENRLLLQLRSDEKAWGHPGGFMELGESVTETAKREVFEETGLRLGKLDFFGIYSGSAHDRKLVNGDEVALIKIMFTCREFEGELAGDAAETLKLQFFPLNELPEIWTPQQPVFRNLISGNSGPFIE